LQQQEVFLPEFANEPPKSIKSGGLDGAPTEAKLGKFAYQSAYKQT